jgi:hypothetical protein
MVRSGRAEQGYKGLHFIMVRARTSRERCATTAYWHALRRRTHVSLSCKARLFNPSALVALFFDSGRPRCQPRPLGSDAVEFLLSDSGRTFAFFRALITRGATMRALCWYGKGDVRVESIAEPRILDARDIILKITSTLSAAPICTSTVN